MPCMWARPTVTELRAIMGLTSRPRILLCRRTCHLGGSDDGDGGRNDDHRNDDERNDGDNDDNDEDDNNYNVS